MLHRLPLFLLIAISGCAALSWEVLWQLEASLSLGVSAVATATVLAATMGGMTVGALLAARWLRDRELSSPIRAYGLLELVIGVSGMLMHPGFRALEQIDVSVYHRAAWLAPLTHLLGIVILLGPPAMAMGATIPVLGLVAERHKTSLSRLYAMNVVGASLGVLGMTFVFLPVLGARRTVWCAVAINVGVAGVAWLVGARERAAESPPPERDTDEDRLAANAWVIAMATGFATFALEVAWFRSLRAAFQSTTDSFAIILASVLVPLAVGAHLAASLRKRGWRLETFVVAAGAAVLLVTPLIERFDMIPLKWGGSYYAMVGRWFTISLAVLGVPILLIGIALPWLLDTYRGPRAWGRLYAVNTGGAILGALATAWLFLPAVGFARTSWGIGLLLMLLPLTWMSPGRRVGWVAAGVVCLTVAFSAESGVGRTRIQMNTSIADYELLEVDEGPDSTVSVVAHANGSRGLVIDGFMTAHTATFSSYMPWMGHLPMMLHPHPRRALVICFGTGQTANAVFQESPQGLDVVDLDATVFAMSHHFPQNEGVLDKDDVRAIVMDGRAWLRRARETYDVITLEPMPPSFAGINSLYSEQFYRLAHDRLGPGGIIAQWMPFHLISPRQSTDIAATFRAVFPDALLWIDPTSSTGIILGRKEGGSARPLASSWYGLSRWAERPPLSPAQIRDAVKLGPEGVRSYASNGRTITDDNQLLAYGRSARFARFLQLYRYQRMIRNNVQQIKDAMRAESRDR